MSIHLSRNEIKTILSGLDTERERLIDDCMFVAIDIGEDEDYQSLVNLQDKLIAYLESLPY